MILKNWQAKAALVFIAALMAAAWWLPALGQSVDGCPTGADCAASSTFDADTDGWSVQSADIGWLAAFSAGFTQADGVVRVYNYQQRDQGTNAMGIYKSFWLQPGQYQIRFRATQDIDWAHGVVVVVDSPDVVAHTWSSRLSEWYFQEFTTSYFTLYSPQMVKVRIATGANAYFDYVYVERLPDTLPTATQIAATNTPGGPTSTPRPTAIPVGSQATPVPAATAVCRPAPTVPDIYATPSAYTGTSFSVVDLFDTGSWPSNTTLAWQRLGGATITQGADHSGNMSGAALLPYAGHYGQTTLSSLDQALVLPVSYGYPVWLNAWAQSDAVPVGQTAQMEVWERSGGSWSRIAVVTISAQQWYPLHAAVSANATEIAFTAVRSDIPSGGQAYLDDVYIYSPESNTPYCNGTYPANTTGSRDTTNLDGVDLQYPANKPCPTAIMQPNNIWGMILAQLTIFLDRQMAMAPLHVQGTTRDLAQQFMIGPLGGVIILGSMVFDWNIPIISMELYITFQAGLIIIGIWKLIRRSLLM